MKNIANDDLVAEVKFRVNNLDVDSIISAGQLEQLIQDNALVPIPQMLVTERPDNAAKSLLEGRVVILVNGSPFAVVAPAVIIDFLSSPEDSNLRTSFSNLLRSLRFVSMLIALLLPAIYIAVANFHTELIPTELLFAIASTRNNIPFPVLFEILLMELAFELIREAGLRMPNLIGPTIGIVGALVLGDAAIAAGLASPILIIIIAITGIASFAIPDYSFGFALRIFRFGFIILAAIARFPRFSYRAICIRRNANKPKIFRCSLSFTIFTIQRK